MPSSSTYLSISVIMLAIGQMVLALSQAWAETPVEVDQYRTKAGHQIHYLRLDKAKDVAIIVNWPSSWIDGNDPVATPYVGSALMMNSGAGERDAATLAADFQDLNARGDIDDRPRAVRGTLVVRPENLDVAVTLGRDVLVDNHLDDRWLERVKQNLIADQGEAHQQLSSESWDTVRRAILRDGRLNDALTLRPTSLINEVGENDIKTWYADTFTTNDMTITAAGPADLDPTVLKNAIDQLLDGLPSGERRNDTTPADGISAEKAVGKTILLHKPNAEKALISIAGPMPPAKGPSYAYDLFAEIVLGSGQKSRLFDAVRTQLRAGYVVGAKISGYDQKNQIISLGGEIDRSHTEQALDAFRDAYESFRLDGVSEDEFAHAKDILTAHFREVAKQPGTMARLLMRFLLDEDPMLTRIADMSKAFADVTLDDVNAAVRERLPAFDDMVRVVTTPEDDAIVVDCLITSVADVDNCQN